MSHVTSVNSSNLDLSDYYISGSKGGSGDNIEIIHKEQRDNVQRFKSLLRFDFYNETGQDLCERLRLLEQAGLVGQRGSYTAGCVSMKGIWEKTRKDVTPHHELTPAIENYTKNFTIDPMNGTRTCYTMLVTKDGIMNLIFVHFNRGRYDALWHKLNPSMNIRTSVTSKTITFKFPSAENENKVMDNYARLYQEYTREKVINKSLVQYLWDEGWIETGGIALGLYLSYRYLF